MRPGIRDGSFSIYALLGLGYMEEAAAFGGWLCDRAGEYTGDGGRPLKIMYRVDGSSDLVEETPGHWAGAARDRCASATAPPASCSSTFTARRWAPSTSPTPRVSGPPTKVGWTDDANRLATTSSGWDALNAPTRMAACSSTVAERRRRR